MTSYAEFLAAKEPRVEAEGFEPGELCEALYPFQRDVVRWALRLGRAAVFADCGLGKTAMQLEWARQVCGHTGGCVLLLAPIAVGPQTVSEADKFGIPGVSIARDQSEAGPGITVTHCGLFDRFDPRYFDGVVLDESSILKSYTGATKRQLCQDLTLIPYKLACTATPAPNDHLELGNHAEFLGVMTSHKMIARWFINDQRTAGAYRLKGHAVRSFWDWVTSWARCIGRPSDMGEYSDEGYELPELRVHHHRIGVNVVEGRSEGELFRQPELSATSVHRENRLTSTDRAERVAELVKAEPHEPWVVWVETNYDADEILSRLPEAIDVRGSMSADEKAARLTRFTREGGVIVTKPGIAGMGLNWQHCARTVFTGLSFSYERYYQAIRRLWRFGQSRPVDAHLVLAATEASVWNTVERKARDHEAMKAEMFAASRRASARSARADDYEADKAAPLPEWLKESA